MKKHKKLVALILSVVALCALTVTSLAVFTDRFQASTTVQAGTLDLNLTQNWASDNTVISTNFRPGTGLKLNYTLANSGNLATDVRETIVISIGQALTSDNPEFELYAASDVVMDANGVITAINGSPVATTYGSYTRNGATMAKLTISPAEFTLSGAGTDGEKITGVSESYTGSYVLVFKTHATNDFQNVTVMVEYLAQGLQHYNTGDETWEDAKVLVDFTFAGETIKAVPALN